VYTVITSNASIGACHRTECVHLNMCTCLKILLIDIVMGKKDFNMELGLIIIILLLIVIIVLLRITFLLQ